MPLFRQENRQKTQESRDLYAAYEIAHTAADFGAALSFLVGSILFFWKDTETAAIWLFVVGSLLFCLKPTLRLAREIHLLSPGEVDEVAKRAEQT